MADDDTRASTTYGAHGLQYLMLPDKLTNKTLLEYIDRGARFTYELSRIIDANAGVLQAKLSRPRSAIPFVGSMTAAIRARRVAAKQRHAAKAMVVVSQYFHGTANEFEALYQPELAAVGYKPRPSDFGWEA